MSNFQITFVNLFQELIRTTKNKGRSSETIRFYVEKGLPYAQYLDDKGVTPEDLHPRHVDEFLEIHRKRGLNQATIDGYMRAIRRFHYFGYRWGVLPKLIKIEIPKRKRAKKPHYTKDQIQKLFDAIDTGLTRMVERDIALLSLLIDSGLRRGEAVALNWEDLTFREDLGIGVVKIWEESKEDSHLASFTQKTCERFQE